MSQGPNEISKQMDGFGKWLRTFIIIILTWVCAAIIPEYIGFIIQDFLWDPDWNGVDDSAAFIAAIFSSILYVLIFAGGIFWIIKIFKKNNVPNGKVLNDKSKMPRAYNLGQFFASFKSRQHLEKKTTANVISPTIKTRPVDLAEAAVEISPVQDRLDDQERSQEAQDNLKAEYGAGFLAIEYRADAKIGWGKIRDLPLKYQVMYLEKLTKNPKAVIEPLLNSIKKQHHTEDNPFESEAQNGPYRRLKKTNERAAHEYKKIIDTLGETVDAEEIAKKLGKKHGSFARLIEVNEANLIDTLKQGVLPDSHFRRTSEDEFNEFIKLKNLSDLPETQLWSLFILYIYEECGISTPKDIFKF